MKPQPPQGGVEALHTTEEEQVPQFNVQRSGNLFQQKFNTSEVQSQREILIRFVQYGSKSDYGVSPITNPLS